MYVQTSVYFMFVFDLKLKYFNKIAPHQNIKKFILFNFYKEYNKIFYFCNFKQKI